MTIAQLMEMLTGKVSSYCKSPIPNATAFDNPDHEFIENLLHKNGFERFGNERMMDGRTGQMMEARIFMGMAQYMVLKQQVIDKWHARPRGPNQLLTRQPVEGRSRDGGLRLGEMERDAILSHGAPFFLKDRLLEQSDPFEVVVCSQCGFFAESAPPQNTRWVSQKAYCRNCDTHEGLQKMVVPYAFKLLHQEMMAMHIGARLKLADNRDDHVGQGNIC